MNQDVLHVWMEGHHVGVFERRDGTTAFEYDPEFEQPISLSLPRQGGWNRKNPEVFLENLLPDNPSTREIMAQSTHAKSTGTFDLLDKADVTGGLVFSREDTTPHTTDDNMIIATDETIAARIVTVRKSTGSWWDSGTKIRFSLAGNQPKFTFGEERRYLVLERLRPSVNPYPQAVRRAQPARRGDRGGKHASQRVMRHIHATMRDTQL